MDDVIAGAYVFTGERSAHSYHLNKMANTLRSAAERARFQADEAGYMREAWAVPRSKSTWYGGATGRQ